MRTLTRIELKGVFTQLAPSFVFNAFIGKNAELFGVGDGGCLMPSGAEGGKRVSVAGSRRGSRLSWKSRLQTFRPLPLCSAVLREDIS